METMRLVLLQVLFCASIVSSMRYIMETNVTYRTKSNQPSLPKECESDAEEESKIFGGRKVQSMKEYPFMVSISLHNLHLCGGFLLSLKMVGTACHCMTDLPDNNESGYAKPLYYLKVYAFSFVAGTANLEHHSKDTQIREAKGLYVHPQCQNKGALIYDQALAVMRKPFFATPFVQPVKMYTWDRKEFEKLFLEKFGSDKKPKCVVTGWGDYRRGSYLVSETSPDLKALEMFVTTERDCETVWTQKMPQNFKGFNFWEYGMICTQSRSGNESDCAGDSGSPYSCDGHLIGSVSFGEASCACGSPSVYATVATFLEWLQKDFPDLVQEAEQGHHAGDMKLRSSNSAPVEVAKRQRAEPDGGNLNRNSGSNSLELSALTLIIALSVKMGLDLYEKFTPHLLRLRPLC